MKFFISLPLLFLFIINLNAQIPKDGTYTFKYCDEEYNKCLGNCKIRISGKKVWVYAPANLSGIKEGSLFLAGTLFNQSTGKWVIIRSEKDKRKTILDADGPAWVDFSKKQFWTF